MGYVTHLKKNGMALTFPPSIHFWRPLSWLLNTGRGRNYQDTKLLTSSCWQTSIPNFSHYHLNYASYESIKKTWNCRALDLHPGNVHLKRTLGIEKTHLISPLLLYQLLQHIFSGFSRILFTATLPPTNTCLIPNIYFLLACVGMCCSQKSTYTNQFESTDLPSMKQLVERGLVGVLALHLCLGRKGQRQHGIAC